MKDENNFTVSIDTNNDKLCRSVFGFGRFDDVELKADSLADIRDHELVYKYNVGLVMGTCVNLEILFYRCVITISTNMDFYSNEIDKAINNIKNKNGTRVKYSNNSIKVFVNESLYNGVEIDKDVKFLFAESCERERVSIFVY